MIVQLFSVRKTIWYITPTSFNDYSSEYDGSGTNTQNLLSNQFCVTTTYAYLDLLWISRWWKVSCPFPGVCSNLSLNVKTFGKKGRRRELGLGNIFLPSISVEFRVYEFDSLLLYEFYKGDALESCTEKGKQYQLFGSFRISWASLGLYSTDKHTFYSYLESERNRHQQRVKESEKDRGNVVVGTVCSLCCRANRQKTQ